jgi:hypothetical protein
MSAPATARNPIAKRVSRWSQPGHADARPHSYPASLSTRQSSPKAIIIGAQATLRPTRAPPSPDRHALAPRVHRQHRNQIAIARASPPPPHLPRVPSLEAFGRRPRSKPKRRHGPSSETLHITGSRLIYRSLRRRFLINKASRPARFSFIAPIVIRFGGCFGLTSESKRNLINALK